MKKTKLHLLVFDFYPIFEQLRLEEALLRTHTDNFCIINKGSTPACVMGISTKPEDVVCKEKLSFHKIPLIKRFSGGGTVVVDEDTLFISFIFHKNDLNMGNCPQKVLEWSEDVYKSAFSPHPFRLRENDYTFGEKKIGGNAQYFTKDRWLHHTSFLWKYEKERMSCLKMPPKMPAYRQSRDHFDFVDCLSGYFLSKDDLSQRIVNKLNVQFDVQEITLNTVKHTLDIPHRKSLSLVE